MRLCAVEQDQANGFAASHEYPGWGLNHGARARNIDEIGKKPRDGRLQARKLHDQEPRMTASFDRRSTRRWPVQGHTVINDLCVSADLHGVLAFRPMLQAARVCERVRVAPPG